MEILPNVSSSSTNNNPKTFSDPEYDVYISFSDVDSRHNFTAHLHKALEYANLKTYLEDQKIEKGEDLNPELESAIKASRIYIIVLSKNYPYSTWFLDELVLILEQHRTSGHFAIPIFYHVSPKDVMNQYKSLKDAMKKHKQRMKAKKYAERKGFVNLKERLKIPKLSLGMSVVLRPLTLGRDINSGFQLGKKIEIWKKALTDVADLKGHQINDGLETELIEEVIAEIYHKLGVLSRGNQPDLIGMDDHVRYISSWFEDGSSLTADFLTIFGMRGSGKTFLAKYVYRMHCLLFDRSSFIEDISRKCSEQSEKLLFFQKQLISQISELKLLQVNDVSAYTTKFKKAIQGKKVLIVLDDVDSLDQLNVLLGDTSFYPGSKILITTRDASLTNRYVLYNSLVRPNHTKLSLKGLDETSSLQLLSLYAFNRIVPMEDYKQLLFKKILMFCEGLPLALKVFGSLLSDRDVAEWEEHIESLKYKTVSKIEPDLRVSFDSLPFRNDKELFLHIACFFVGMDRDFTETILKACDISTVLGIRTLVDRCLLTIGPTNKLTMHPLLQEMGRDVVRRESPNEPWKRSRLWCDDESFEVLKQKKGSTNLIGLTLDMRMQKKIQLGESIELETDALIKMDNLMLLQLNYVQLKGSYKNFPEELRWLCMHGCPLQSLPSDLPMENLVSLDMSYSKIEVFDMSYSNPQRLGKAPVITGPSSNDRRLLGSLKFLNLSFCKQLRHVGGFVKLPLLESLIVSNCIGLIEVSESIDQCVELVLIDLSYCSKIQKLPTTLGKLNKVRTLLLNDCHLRELPLDVRDDPNFVRVSLPGSLVKLSLANNKLSNKSFSMDFSFLSMLKYLYIDGNPIVSMPNCVRSLPRLETLSMDDCKMLISVEHPPCTLRRLKLDSYSKNNHFLRKIVFDPEMSPLKLSLDPILLAPSSFEIEGMVKIQPMAGVDDMVLHSLGWTDLEFTKERRMKTSHRGPEESQIQMYYEFGIFSTFYGGEMMPNWITHCSKGTSISFTIPSSPNKLRGLNLSYMIACPARDSYLALSKIKISNITKDRTWIYHHYIDSVNVAEEFLIFVSHWMFGTNEMEDDDQVIVTATDTEECGISLVYDDGKIDEEDPLGYYKSWNHIIGGDLSVFQTKIGEYILNNTRFLLDGTNEIQPIYLPFVAAGSTYKEEEVWFKAFSKKKSDMLEIVPEWN